MPVPEGVEGDPRPSLLWVKVSAEGRTVDAQRLRSSDNADFERAVRYFVWTVTWQPVSSSNDDTQSTSGLVVPSST